MFTIDTQTNRSPNHGSGVEWENNQPVYHGCTIKPLGVLLHSSEGTRASDLPWLAKPYHPIFNPEPVSTNYYIQTDGYCAQMVPDTLRAWHAGPGAWPGVSDGNALIGVELEHKKNGTGYTAIQMDALRQLCLLKIQQYGFGQKMFLAHRWWAPTRKQDPTNWSDADIQTFIAHLFNAPVVRHWRVKTATPVYEAPAVDPARIAWQGACLLSPPMIFDSDDDSHPGFAHWPPAGFVPVTALEAA